MKKQDKKQDPLDWVDVALFLILISIALVINYAHKTACPDVAIYTYCAPKE